MHFRVLRVLFTLCLHAGRARAEQSGGGVDWVDRGSISRISDYVAAAMYVQGAGGRANHYFLAGRGCSEFRLESWLRDSRRSGQRIRVVTPGSVALVSLI